MTGPKKRGASSGQDGRGGKKRAVVPASPRSGSNRGSGSRSSGKEKVDPLTKKMNKALENAHKLSIAVKQHTIEDVKNVTWKLKTDAEGVIQSTYAGFKGVLDDRRKLFKNVMSLVIHGVAVTQPQTNETYHTIDIEVDDKVVLQLLFRQSDGYLVAFRRRRVSADDDSVWEGWYYFKDADIILPSFCEEKEKLNIVSSYNYFLQVRFGKGIVSSIVKCLLAFTRENCAARSFGEHNRVVLFETLMVFFGECQRSGLFLEFAESHFESEDLVPVTEELSKHRHSWINLSRVLMELYLGYLYQKHRLHGWEDLVKHGEKRISEEITEFTALGHNGIERFIVYDMADPTKPNFRLSLRNLLGSDVGQLLHLIKYAESYVQDIHLARMKVEMNWPMSQEEIKAEMDWILSEEDD